MAPKGIIRSGALTISSAMRASAPYSRLRISMPPSVECPEEFI